MLDTHPGPKPQGSTHPKLSDNGFSYLPTSRGFCHPHIESLNQQSAIDNRSIPSNCSSILSQWPDGAAILHLADPEPNKANSPFLLIFNGKLCLPIKTTSSLFSLVSFFAFSIVPPPCGTIVHHPVWHGKCGAIAFLITTVTTLHLHSSWIWRKITSPPRPARVPCAGLSSSPLSPWR